MLVVRLFDRFVQPSCRFYWSFLGFMQSKLLLTSNLRSIICAIIAGKQTLQQLNEFVSVCHALATTTLRHKIAAAMLQSRFHYSSYSDMAYDCIADLFSRDNQDVLVRVKSYFEGVDIVQADDEELLAHLRRLIASKVNQGVFRIYGEIDPGLGKILRNIKLAIQSLESFTVSSRFGDWHLCPNMIEANQHLPTYEAQELERELCRTANGNDAIPDLLSKLSLLMRKQDTNSRSVPLMTVARVFRSIYSHDGEIADTAEPEDRFIVPDTTALIKEVCTTFKREMEPKYVGKKKVSPDIFESYFTVIEQSLVDHFVGNDGDMSTFYEKLSALKPGITREEYYDGHRAVVEYLGRLVRERVVERLKANT